MRSKLKISLVILAFACLLISCNKSNDLGKMVPSNASFLVHLDGKSFTSKLSWEEIKSSEWFKKASADTSIKDWMKKILDNPENSGINMKGDLVMFLLQGEGGANTFILEGDVKDATAFESFNKNIADNAPVTKDGDISSVTIRQEAVGAWNSKKFVYAFAANNSTQNLFDTTGYAAPAGADMQKLSRLSKGMFTLKSDSSLAKNERFTAMLNEEGDIHMWQNTEAMLKNNAAMRMLGMFKIDAFIKGNVSTATVNFENGAIRGKQKMYGSPELIDVLKKYGGGEINTTMISNIPSKNIAGILSIHFKPEGLKEFIKLTGLDGMINMAMSQFNISIDDFVGANKGDIMLSVSDISVAPGNENNSNANVLFSVAIGDSARFNKLLNAGAKLGGQMKNDTSIYFTKNDKFFVIGNNQTAVNTYNAGGNSSFPFLDKIKGHPIALYIDLNRIINSFAVRPSIDSSDKILLQESAKMWQDVYVTGGDIKKDAFETTGEINLVDKSTNSLKQLSRYFDRMAPAMEEKHKRKKAAYDNYNTDSTVTF
ncbi:hypothetical protein BH09BAC2_BH09BAC2_21850 [soil metagenome]